jgi:uncharacterized protein YhhL (DUF1145 family)
MLLAKYVTTNVETVLITRIIAPLAVILQIDLLLRVVLVMMVFGITILLLANPVYTHANIVLVQDPTVVNVKLLQIEYQQRIVHVYPITMTPIQLVKYVTINVEIV